MLHLSWSRTSLQPATMARSKRASQLMLQGGYPSITAPRPASLHMPAHDLELSVLFFYNALPIRRH